MLKIGAKYGKLTIVFAGERDRGGHRTYTCICDCGAPTVVRDTNLTTGHTTSCGCAAAASNKTHGERNSRTYQSWRAMRKRCNDPKNVQYVNYGARGIRVCAEWNDSKTGYEAFKRDMGERPRGMTLDRKEVNGDYEPGNCAWATSTQQAWNKRGTRALREDAEENAYWQQQEEEWYARNEADAR